MSSGSEKMVTLSMADLETMMDRQRVEMEQTVARAVDRKIQSAAVALAKGPSSTTIGEILERHAAEQCDPRSPVRPDHKLCRQYVRLQADLVFEFEGRPMSFRGLPLNEARPEMLDEWVKQVGVTKKPGRWTFEQRLATWAKKVNRLRATGRPVTAAGPEPKPDDGEFYSESTANRMIGSFQTAVTWFCGNRRHNPFKGIARHDVEDEGRKGFFRDEDQLADFLRHCRPVLADMWRLGTQAGGMRKSELRLLVVSEVDWQQRTITFPRGDRTKNRKGRTFPVRDEEMPLLRRYRAEVEQRDPCDDRDCPMLAILRADRKSATHWHLFADPNAAAARPIEDGTLTSWQQEAAARWGQLLSGEVVTMHHSRHTFATWSIARGVPTSVVMREGGWRTLKVFNGYEKASDALLAACRQSRSRSMKEILAFGDALDARNAKKEAA